MDKINNIEDAIKLSLKDHQNGFLEKAENAYKAIIKDYPKNSIVPYLLGTLKAQQKNLDEAEFFIKKSISLDNNNADAHYNLGIVFQNKKKFSKAIDCYLRAVKLNKNYLKSYYNLGQIYLDEKKYADSIEAYKNVLDLDQNHLPGINNLAIVYSKIKDFENSKIYFEKLVINEPNNPEFHYNYAAVLQEMKEYENSVKYYKKAIELKKIYPKAFNNLGFVFKKLEKFNESKKCYETAITQDPSYAIAFNNYANLLDLMCECKSAIKAYKKSIEFDPAKLSTRWALMNTFPVIYKNNQEIKDYQKKFQENLNSIIKFLDSNKDLSKENILVGLKNSTNFYLHYQGLNNLPLQKKYSEIIDRLTTIAFPQYHKNIDILKKDKNLKIGFVSSTCFLDHSVSSVIRNLIINLNSKIFDIYVYHINEESDKMTNLFKKKIKKFNIVTDIEKIIEKIAKDKLDILIYTDIGIDPKVQIIGSLRLAPVQCQTLGHPISSGLKNIDYFLSSELMEIDKADKHYAEKLIRLPNTAQCYDLPKSEDKIKLNKKINNEIIFFNIQNLIKLLPNDDELCIKIVKEIPNCKIWFLRGKNSTITRLFTDRLKNLFEKNNLDFEKHIVILGRLSQKDFFKLLEKNNVVILDSLNWSGNCTSHQALALQKPIITLPGESMRSRHTYALLKRIDLDETIANSMDEYVNIAKRIYFEKKFRIKIQNKIIKNIDRLFNDKSPILFFEKFLIELFKN